MITVHTDMWWLAISVITLVVNLIGAIYVYLGVRKGQRDLLYYLPGICLVILGLGFNISRHLAFIPPEFSQYVLWFAVSTVTIGLILIERQRRRDMRKS